jgi:hypothetical protein
VSTGEWRRLHRSPRWRRRGLTFAIGLALTFVPLVGTLGYEHAFVLGPLAALGGIAVGVDTVRDARARGGARLRELLAAAARELGILCAIAVAMPLVGQLWQRACEPLGGLGFFAVGPVFGAALGMVCGLWGGVLGSTRRRACLIGVTPMLLCTAIGLWRLYADPVVFAYDPFFGYFSGSVYDEAVSIGRSYLVFRAYNLLWAAAALLAFAVWVDPELRVARLARRTAIVRTTPIAVLTLGCLLLGLRGAQLGFTANLASITEALSASYETEHFIIYYLPRSADARTILAIAAEHEFAYQQLRTVMQGREPDGRVTSFVFATADQKRKLMGAGTVQVAAPWRRQIYLDHRAFPHPVLQHELAHIFGASVGDAIFGASRSGFRLNVGLIEGFATALAPRESDRLDLHDQAAVLGKLGKRPPMAAIMGPGFFTKSSQIAYTAAGSFCLWLIETRGFEPMALLYRSAGDFEAAYGEGIEPLEREWLAFLDAREIDDADVAAVAQRFERTSVFERPCAHRAAEVRTEIDRAIGRGGFDDAVIGYQRLCTLEPEQPEHALGLALAHALAGELSDAHAVLVEAAARDGLTTSMRAAIAERDGDVALVLGDLVGAREAYARALAQPQSEARLRVLQLRQAATSDPRLAPLVLAYLAPFDGTDDELTRTVTSTWAAAEIAALPGFAALGRYLLARQLLNAERPAAAAIEIDRALVDDGASLPSPEFVRAARLARLEAMVLLGDWDGARRALARLEREPDQARGYLAQWDEWRARIEFHAAWRGPTSRG